MMSWFQTALSTVNLRHYFEVKLQRLGIRTLVGRCRLTPG